MTDASKNPFEAMLAQAQEMLKAVNPAMANMVPEQLEKMWPQMSPEMLEAFMGKQFNPEGLDAKTRLLLMLQGLTIQGALAEAQIRMTVRQAVVTGATPQEVAEAIGLGGMFGGMPAMNKAMELAKEAIDGASDTGQDN